MTQQSATPTLRSRAAAAAVIRREIDGEREWLHLELTAADGAIGHGWVPYADGIRAVLETALDPAASGHADSATSDERRLAQGVLAAAESDVVCHRHGCPLHRWLGGPLRRHVQVAWPLTFRASSSADRDDEIADETARAVIAARQSGVTTFVVHDLTTDVERIATTVHSVRRALGSRVWLSLRLAGQLDTRRTEALLDRVREAHLTCVADPCSLLEASLEASSDRLPALGLTAARYDRQALLTTLIHTPPAVLVIDPLFEGGPGAVLRIASIARVLRTAISLTADSGSAWLTHLCAELAAVLPAVSQPLELPSTLTPDALTRLGVANGVLDVESPALSASVVSERRRAHGRAPSPTSL